MRTRLSARAILKSLHIFHDLLLLAAAVCYFAAMLPLLAFVWVIVRWFDTAAVDMNYLTLSLCNVYKSFSLPERIAFQPEMRCVANTGALGLDKILAWIVNAPPFLLWWTIGCLACAMFIGEIIGPVDRSAKRFEQTNKALLREQMKS